MLDLFTAQDVRIERIGSVDAQRRTDSLVTLCSQLATHEPYYGGIKRWVTDKVVPDLRVGIRTAYIGFSGDTPILAAVVKTGNRAKFCHLSIESGFRGNRLGHLMFSLMAADVRQAASEIHFTLPEGLWEREREFFKSFGFETAERASAQYRLFEEELRCSAKFQTVWTRIIARLPILLESSSVAGFRNDDGFVLSLSESSASAVMAGRKRVDLRRSFSDRWVGRSATVYAMGSPGALLGTVKVESYAQATPREIWDAFGDELNCTFDEFERTTAGRTSVCAVKLAEPRPYQAPISLSQLSFLLGASIPAPKSEGMRIGSATWSKALSMAALLHGRSTSNFR